MTDGTYYLIPSRASSSSLRSRFLWKCVFCERSEPELARLGKIKYRLTKRVVLELPDPDAIGFVN
jgi:hypothetical protein